MTADDLMHQFSMTRLVRTEISTLIGLMFRKNIDFSLPSPDVAQEYIEKTESLLQELHHSMMVPMIADFNPSKISREDFNPFTSGAVLREPIFYGGESAYNFQYRDFSIKKYAKDNPWFEANKGFSIENANAVLSAIAHFQNGKIFSTLEELRGKDPAKWSMLSAFTFTENDIASISGIDLSTVSAVINAFTPPKGALNQEFKALNDFNITNAYPIILMGNGEYLLYQNYSLVEALYETPFYWFHEDKAYVNVGMKNRGEFTEEFSAERLKLVFGKNRVFSNIDLIDSKGNQAGEIDVLVVFANRAIVLQAKSKKLTIASRKGNDNCIKDDFKKSVQESYDQGLSCAKLLSDKKYSLRDADGNKLVIQRNFKEKYIFCVVSDHYPALSFQSRQFLKFEESENILPPFIMDIFLLDVMTEMLQTPLHFLSYINRRTQYSDKINAMHELTVLSYHLKQNLWLDSEYSLMHLGDDICADLDLAMMVRRESIQGKSTPDGILTRTKGTTIANLILQIENLEEPGTIDLGIMLLSLNEDTVFNVSKGIEQIAELAQKDHKHHDLTVGIGEGSTGLTIHCNYDPIPLAGPRLQTHCERRKYTERAKNWFGVCIDPSSLAIKFGIWLDCKWQPSKHMDEIVKDMPKGLKKINFGTKVEGRKKIGRNDQCPCGSGIKYKKCCLNG
ncbi:SEC-C domain-containing protein [Candidatus Babeliales bacterium]|nr:SEC-C domain-containing protein [Candidatus Babeliales bacterium]